MTHALRLSSLRPLVAALLGACVSVAMAADPRASKYYEDALVRFEKQDHKGAIVQLKNAIKLDRKMLPLHVLLGRALLASGEINAAEAAFDEALKLGVNPAEVVLPLAEALSEQGKPSLLLSEPRFAHAGLPGAVKVKLVLIKAAAASDLGNTRESLKLLDEVRALDPSSAEGWLAEVPIRIRARQLAEAKVAADKAVAIDPKSHKAAYQQASVAHVSGDLKTAVALYTGALGLKAAYNDALVARAGIYIDLNRPAEAAADVQAARKSDPRDPRSAYLAALLAERTGNTAEVKKALNEVTNLLDPLPADYVRYRPQLLILGGLSHFGLGQYEKAKPYLETAQRQDSNSPVSKLLAQIYLRDRQTDKAIESLELYLRVRPNDSQALMLLASANMASGRHARAAQLMQEGLKKTDDNDMRALLGRSLVGAGKFGSGAAELEAVLKKDPNQIAAGVTLTGLYIASDQGTKAATVADALFKRQPKSPGLANLLGTALTAKGDADNARKAFEEALKLDASFLEPQINLARLDIDQKALDAALKRLNTVLAKDEKNMEAAMEVARLFSARSKPEESLRWLQRADDHSGPRLQAGMQMVEFHLARNRPDLAREPLKRLQSRAPESLVVLLLQARVQLANKESADAKSTLTRAATLAAYDAAALVQIANLQLSGGNPAGAAHALDKALVVRADHLGARAVRADVFLMQGEPAKAEQLARSVLASDPKLGLGHSLLGDVARYRKQMPAAIEAYRKAHQLDQSNASLLRLFSSLESTKPESALALVEQWLKTRSSDVNAWRMMAGAQARAANMAGAKASFEKVTQLDPGDAEGLNNLASVMVALRDPDALKVAEKALAIKPGTAHIIGTAGWAAFHGGQPDKALQLLRDARLRDPSNPNTRYFLSAVLAQQGRKSEALQELSLVSLDDRRLVFHKEARDLLTTLK